ncbi:septation ring formation regulator EzrA [Frankia sp. R43]|uniref:FtsB family cell division protein n=1 Tax=Frankia sp. R43 TaxID=269536 RepID=UPI0006CA3523|nr:septum formation initiator family protein [Frankia sp. R43]KPM57491.1 septation ring formation regulator EzrA [Frankia sp. R43]
MPFRRRALTTRATLLAIVICVLVLTLAYPLRLYLQQQAKISELTRTNAQRQTRVDDLREEVARYNDPEWVKDEARRRLHYVLPGEKTYLMQTSPQPTPEPDAGADGGGGGQSWYNQLWSQLAEPATPTPAAQR